MKKFGAKHIIGLLFCCCAAVFLVLCLATDLNDGLFLPLALGCVTVGSCMSLAIQLEARKKDRENRGK